MKTDQTGLMNQLMRSIKFVFQIFRLLDQVNSRPVASKSTRRGSLVGSEAVCIYLLQADRIDPTSGIDLVMKIFLRQFSLFR